MNKFDSPFSILSTDEMAIVVELQSHFDIAWKRSQAISIESLLATISPRGGRLEQVALHHLILSELEHRIDRQENPNILEYLERFPSHLYVVQNCFSMLRESAKSIDIIGPLAEGGLGTVDVAWDRTLNRKVAYKRLKATHSDDKEKQDRFRREAVITARLRHPGIVSIYSMGEDADGQVSYVMPLIEGEPLNAVIDRFHKDLAGAQPNSLNSSGLRRLLQHFVDVCQAIAYAHSQGCVHRDLKPQNVMVGSFGETVVVDWGLAKFFGERDESTDDQAPVNASVEKNIETISATHTGDVFGTPMYMSPEQAVGKTASVGPASDIYSLGVILYNLLTGSLPFKGTDSKVLLAAVVDGKFTKPRLIQRSIPAALEAICLKCMALDPKNRYTSVECLIEDLDSWAVNETVVAYAEPWHYRVVRMIRRHPTWYGVAAVSIVSILIGLAVVTTLTTIKNQQLNTAIASVKSESDRADQMYQFFVDELTVTSPIENEAERVTDINQLLEHMIRSSEKFRDASPVTHAKLLLSISNICKERSEFRSGQIGYESLLSYLGEHTDGLPPELREMIVPVKLKLAECYLPQAGMFSRIEPLLTGLRPEELNESDRIVFVAVMGWCKYFQGNNELAQSYVDQYPRGTSANLDRLQAMIWTSTDKGQEACVLLNELIQELPESKAKDGVLLYNTLANVYRRLNQFDDAESCTLKSIELADRYYLGHDQSRLMPRGLLMDVYYGSGRFEEALAMSQQIKEILDQAPDNATMRQMIPVLNFRRCIFRLGAPNLEAKQAEAILQDLSTLKLAQPDQVYELLAVRYLVACFLSRDELANESLQVATQMLRGASESPDVVNNSRLRGEFLGNLLLVNRRLAKVSAVNGLSQDFERFLESSFPESLRH